MTKQMAVWVGRSLPNEEGVVRASILQKSTDEWLVSFSKSVGRDNKTFGSYEEARKYLASWIEAYITSLPRRVRAWEL